MNRTDMEVLRDEIKNSLKDYSGIQSDPYRNGRKHQLEATLFRVEAIIYRAKMKKCSKVMLAGAI